MQAILTKFHGPTNTKGARISAQSAAKKIFRPYDYALDIEENHKCAAYALMTALHWQYFLIGGTLPNEDKCWVLTESR